MIPLSYYLLLSALLFSIGIYGILTKRNAILMLMSIEIMLNASNINLVAFSAYTGTLSGHVFALFSIAVGASEAAVGLAIFLLVFRTHGTIDVSKLRILKW